MNFLFVLVKDSVYDLPMVLEHMGHSVTILEHYPFNPLETVFTPQLLPVEDALNKNKFDYVITYLYITQLSNLCEKYQIPYIAWIYDSPLISVFHESIFNSMNRIFVFDKTMYDRLNQLGIPHVYYMPLAANTNRINALNITAEDEQQYSCDISFVGSLYEKNAYNELMHQLPTEVIVPMNHYLMQHLCDWKGDRSWPVLPDIATQFLTDNRLYDTSVIDKFQMPANMYLGILFLSRKLAEMERITALNTLAEAFPVDIYTGSESEHIAGLRQHPPVNYYLELGKVYYLSKINLNFTLPSIESGVPLRVYDIMAHGGFVMSSYQKEFDTLFTPGKDIVVFHDLIELKEQAAYYLSHEEERIRIAAEGYQTVNRYYSYEHQIEKILAICENLKDTECS